MADSAPLTRVTVDGGQTLIPQTGQFIGPTFAVDAQEEGFNIQRFKALTEGKRGFVKPSKFLARIPIPLALQGITEFTETGRDLSFWCDTASLPGAALATRDVARYGYGVREKRPFSNIFQDLNFVFYADGGTSDNPTVGTNWNFFTTWVRSISNFDMTQGLMMDNTSTPNTGNINSQPYEVSYKYEYVSDIEIQIFRTDGSKSHVVVLRDAFPTYVQEITTRWADDSNVMAIPVLFTYTDWYPKYSIE